MTTKTLIQQIKKRLPAEIIRAIRTFLQAEPTGIGVALDIQIFERIAEREEERFRDFVYSLADEAGKVASITSVAIRKEFFDTDEFRFILRDAISRAAKEHREEKIKAFRAILLNCMISDPKFLFNRKVFFLEVVDSLSPEHLKLLRLLAARERVGSKGTSVEKIWREFQAIDKATKNYVFSGLDILANRVLIETGAIPFDVMSSARRGRSPGSKRERAVRYQRIARSKQTFAITELGREFVSFTTSPLETEVAAT